MCVSFDPHFNVLIGFATTFLLGLSLPKLMDRIGHNIGYIQPPQFENFSKWIELMSANSGGYWIGHLERPMFFACFWVSSLWPIVGAWLVMKTAFYWQGTNYAKFPDEPPSQPQMDWLVAKRRLGAYYAATALAGTAANIVFALAGIAIGHWLRFQ